MQESLESILEDHCYNRVQPILIKFAKNINNETHYSIQLSSKVESMSSYKEISILDKENTVGNKHYQKKVSACDNSTIEPEGRSQCNKESKTTPQGSCFSHPELANYHKFCVERLKGIEDFCQDEYMIATSNDQRTSKQTEEMVNPNINIYAEDCENIQKSTFTNTIARICTSNSGLNRSDNISHREETSCYVDIGQPIISNTVQESTDSLKETGQIACDTICNRDAFTKDEENTHKTIQETISDTQAQDDVRNEEIPLNAAQSPEIIRNTSSKEGSSVKTFLDGEETGLLSCIYCSRKISKTTYIWHVRMHVSHDFPFYCFFCHERFQGLITNDQHEKECPLNPTRVIVLREICEICQGTFVNLVKLKALNDEYDSNEKIFNQAQVRSILSLALSILYSSLSDFISLTIVDCRHE